MRRSPASTSRCPPMADNLRGANGVDLGPAPLPPVRLMPLHVRHSWNAGARALPHAVDEAGSIDELVRSELDRWRADEGRPA